MVPVLEIVLAFMGSAKGKFFEKEFPKRIVLNLQAEPFGSGGLDFLRTGAKRNFSWSGLVDVREGWPERRLVAVF